MTWNELYAKEHAPSEELVVEFVDTPLWNDLTTHLQQTYNVKPKLSYSGCGMDNGYWKGWNVKYKKSGKALCSLYPKQGYFLALIAVGANEATEADLLIPFCDPYTQELYKSSDFAHHGGKSLAFEVTNDKILHDIKQFIKLRVPAKKSESN
jgi:AraC family transcriptional regulator